MCISGVAVNNCVCNEGDKTVKKMVINPVVPQLLKKGHFYDDF